MGRVLITLAFLALSACGGSSISVNTDFDPIASPKAATYRTWNWLRTPAGTPARADSSVQATVERTIESRLLAMGYQKSDTNPDFRVGWHAALTDPLDVTTVNSYYGCAWGRWFPGGGVVYTKGFRTQFEPGSLVIDVADSRASELIWRGTAREVFGAREKEGDRERTVTEAVAQMLADFPPRLPTRQ
jgi:hypothetical protein